MRTPAYLKALFAEYEAVAARDPRHNTQDQNRSLAYYQADIRMLKGDIHEHAHDRVSTWVRTAHRIDQYISENGHAPRRNSRRASDTPGDAIRLAFWLEDQRRRTARERQCAYQRERIAAFPSVDARDRDERWRQTLERYREFLAARHRTPSARSKDTAERSLGIWATRQRRLYRAGGLPADRSEALAALPVWTWGHPNRS